MNFLHSPKEVAPSKPTMAIQGDTVTKLNTSGYSCGNPYGIAPLFSATCIAEGISSPKSVACGFTVTSSVNHSAHELIYVIKEPLL